MGNYRYRVQRSPNHSSRSNYGYGPTPTGITIHWWGNYGQNHYNVANYLCRRGGNTSAHEVISDGLVSHLVDFDRAAWHSGSTPGNGGTIGLECRPEMTAGDLETVAQRCADIEKHFNKSMRYYGHKDWSATACPGTWYNKLGWIINRVNEIHAGKGPSKPAPAPKEPKETTGKDDIMPLVPITAPSGQGWHAVGLPAKNGSTSVVVDRIYVSFSPLFARAYDIELAVYDVNSQWMNPAQGKAAIDWVEKNDTIWWRLPDGAASARLAWKDKDGKMIPNIFLEVKAK